MTWTKVGAEVLTAPNFVGMSRSARLLSIEATVWCNQHGTNGFVPAYMLPRICDAQDVNRLTNQLWRWGHWVPRLSEKAQETYSVDPVEDSADPRITGWTLIDFLDNQPSADDVKRTRELWAERQRRQRQHRGGDHSLCDARYCHQAKAQQPAPLPEPKKQPRKRAAVRPTSQTRRA